jgi:hypothetical protein
MNRRATELPGLSSMTVLSRLLLRPSDGDSPRSPATPARDAAALWLSLSLSLSVDEFEDVLALAHLNHVVVRALEEFLSLARQNSRHDQGLPWLQSAESALSSEKARIKSALFRLHEVCAAFQDHGYGVTVMKTLDHWPDFGSDMDLFTNAQPHEVSQLMEQCFKARMAPRSWGDHLANKWNFLLPDLPEPIEIHVGRLGQTGEQVLIASTLETRTRQIKVGGYQFRVPSISDRLMISALQRVYRHFNIRLCDIVDNAAIADAGLIDYQELRFLAESAGIWEGVATYLAIISDYVRTYRGTPLDLPQFVLNAARFGGAEIYYNHGFLRVPIMPQSARLYGSEFAHVLGRGEIENCARLSLLPFLGAAALAAERITGSDKGIW